jgi:hypothetical protein
MHGAGVIVSLPGRSRRSSGILLPVGQISGKKDAHCQEKNGYISCGRPHNLLSSTKAEFGSEFYESVKLTL